MYQIIQLLQEIQEFILMAIMQPMDIIWIKVMMFEKDAVLNPMR